MSEHLALYRKYRPASFSEVVGQEQLVQSLERAVKEKNPAHAYVFAGTRGVGKTTLARIFAHALGVTDKDTYELDAASNNSVDDIRDLRESVGTLPFESPYKVYILDEAHMLSKSAFNAFLKTLEEPPHYCIFILATTEPEKLPQTILSRVQLFTLKSPTRKEIGEVLRTIAKKEGYTLEEGADDLLATLGNGSFRDAISILQKVFGSITKQSASARDVEAITGAPRGELLTALLRALGAGDSAAGLEIVHQLMQHGTDMSLGLELLIERTRAVLLMRHGGVETKKLVAESWSSDDMEVFTKLASEKNSGITSRTLLALLEAEEQMRFVTAKQIPLELVIMNTART